MNDAARFRQQSRGAMAGQRQFNLGGHISANNYDGVLENIRTQEFNDGMNIAYNNKHGYSIKYINGEKVMFVSGSRNHMDWALNAVDTVVPQRLQFITNRTAKNLDQIARKEGVDVVVGHSRGGQIVSKMSGSYQKLGVDAAMINAKDKNMMNIAQKGALDRFIDRGFGRRATKYSKFAQFVYNKRGRNTKTYKKDKSGGLSTAYNEHYVYRQGPKAFKKTTYTTSRSRKDKKVYRHKRWSKFKNRTKPYTTAFRVGYGANY